MTRQEKNLILLDFYDLSLLALQATKFEAFIKEEKQRGAHFSKGQTMILVIEDIFEEEEDELAGDARAAEIMDGKAYTCLTIKTTKEKEPSHLNNKEAYSFDISWTEQIFYHFLKEKKIRLINGQKLPMENEIKDKNTVSGIIPLVATLIIV